jgi:DNA-binding transcriptional LysR family regulator
MDFDERHLRAFLAVAETGSLGRAAAVVNLTQPSLSRMIQAMEQRLGHKLFERQSKGMALTAAGEILLPHARLLAFEMRAARDQLDALRGLRRGVVRVGAVAAAMRTLVAQALGTLLARHPQLTAQTLEEVDDGLLGALLERRVDVVVTASALDHHEVECLGTCAYADNFGVFAAADHPLSGGAEPVALPDLVDQGWVMPGPGATPRVQFEARFRAAGLPVPAVVVESASVETMVAVAAHSRLLCWLPEPLVMPHLAMGTLGEVPAPALSHARAMRLYRRRAGLLPEAARQFVRCLPLEA